MGKQRNVGARRVVIAVAGALALVGCSDGGGADGGGTADADVTVAATEYQFSPSTWSVSAGTFTVAFSNDGSTEHEWAVIDLGEDISSEAEFAEDKVLLEVEAVAAGESSTEEFTIDEAGTYQVICALEGHFDQGMEGTLTVE